ncbi:hypothetical protein Bca52824_095100 [Brassica carinata]|uniref:Uncharacterized protein n=1 Tax=Brassica carinata TaxID=52824 RepID=A0A8X7P0Z4_BRACI|nr:hypothetical protein Bca52824_095100 [Brassica carinata]
MSERRSRTDLANDIAFGSRLLPRVGNRAAAHAASSPDSDLEALSHNPATVASPATGFSTKPMTNCANQRFLSHQEEPTSAIKSNAAMNAIATSQLSLW